MRTPRRRATPIVLGALVGVVIIGIIVVLATAGAAHSGSAHAGLFLHDGPLATDGQDIETIPAPPGGRIAYAGLTLFNVGTTPVVLESARLYPTPRGMPQIGAYAVPPGRALNAVEFIPWPHETDPRFAQDVKREQPLAGAALPPTALPHGQGAELLLVFRPSAGVHFAPYVYIRYRIGTTQYAERLPRGVFICGVAQPAKTYVCGHSLSQKIDRGSALGG